MKEEAFRQQVRRIARMYGWTMQYHTHNSQRSDAGWPDEVFANNARKRIIFVEFKSQKGRITLAQQQWIDTLQLMGLEADIWRPTDMHKIVEVLGPKQRLLNTSTPTLTEQTPDEEGWHFPGELDNLATETNN